MIIFPIYFPNNKIHFYIYSFCRFKLKIKYKKITFLFTIGLTCFLLLPEHSKITRVFFHGALLFI
jgi:hypothetical protein